MRAVVTAETRLDSTPDGRVWTSGGPSYDFWQRYLAVFDNVRLVTRVRRVEVPPDRGAEVTGPSVEVWSLPHYIGPFQYLSARNQIRKSLFEGIGKHDAVILRVSSPIASMVSHRFKRVGRPYALEVVGDPYDMFSRDVVQHPLRPVIRGMTTRALQRQCRHAAVVAYVTEAALQRRYPAGRATSFGFSDVALPPTAFAETPRMFEDMPRVARIVSVGAIEQPYKGIDDLISAVAILQSRGIDVRYEHVGGGKLLPALEEQARRLRVSHLINFRGAVSGAGQVRECLDGADMFVLPSRTEGLPRAVVEAMARGLPAISTAVGGIPELLPAEALVRPNNPTELADAIASAVSDASKLARWSAINLARAQDFAEEKLRQEYTRFYQHVRTATECWAAS